ncbi:Transmembrane protein [Paraburkholderia sacchari]
MDKAGRLHRHRWPMRCFRGACICLMLAIGTTWLGAIHDFPVDANVVAGMALPECATVRAIPAGSRLAAALPDSDRCIAFFMYRTSFPNAADDAASYQTWVMQQRVGEFWQLIGYVLALWFVLLCIVAIAAATVKALVRRLRHTFPANTDPASGEGRDHTRGCP